jgi:hypothetical protein
MPTCVRFARGFLLCVNSLFGILGISTACTASYGIIRFSELASLFSVDMLGMLLGVGVCIAGLALLGSASARKSSMFLLTLYSFFVFVIVVIELVLGILVGIFTGNLSFIKTHEYQSVAQQELTNLVSCAYSLCCSPAASRCAQPVFVVCNATVNFHITMPYAVCEAINRYDVSLLAQQCTSTETLTSALYTIVAKTLWPIGMTVVAVACAQVLCLVFACYMMCGKHHAAVPPPASPTTLTTSPSLLQTTTSSSITSLTTSSPTTSLTSSAPSPKTAELQEPNFLTQHQGELKDYV